MLKHLLFVLIILCFTNGYTQTRILDSITGIADRSYDLSAAFAKAKKYDSKASYPVVEMNQMKSKHVLLGNSIEFEIFLPHTPNKATIILLFGGGWRSGSTYMMHAMCSELVRMGYTVVLPSYVLSTHAQYPTAIVELKKVISYIRTNASEWTVDANKISIAGFSAGGMMASLIAATNRKELFNDCVDDPSLSEVNALINIDGILSFVHPESGEGDDSKKLSAATMWLGYKKMENFALWEEASPLTHVDSTAPPSLFINSGIVRMHAGREDYKKKLDEFGIYHEQKTFDIDLHHFPFFEPWFSPTIFSMDTFLRKVFSLN